VITIFCSALFGQLSFEFLFLIEEDRVKLAYFFQLILENLSLRNSLYYNFQELILILRVFYQHLRKERVKSMSRGCNKASHQNTYINFIRGSLQVGVERLYILPVSFGIYGGSYKPTDVESSLHKV
jgi:hypothetical protein